MDHRGPELRIISRQIDMPFETVAETVIRKIELFCLVENLQGGYIATVSDDAGAICARSASSPQMAALRAFRAAIDLLRLSSKDDVDLHLMGLTEEVDAALDEGIDWES